MIVVIPTLIAGLVVAAIGFGAIAIERRAKHRREAIQPDLPHLKRA